MRKVLVRVATALCILVLLTGVFGLPPGVWVLAWGAINIWDKAQPEIHLVPEGYEGPVVIVFNSATGEPEERENRARVYRIPMTGVLRTQFPPNPGWSRPDYFWVDPRGQRHRIVTGAPCDSGLAGDPLEACLMGKMWIGERTIDYDAYVVSHDANRRAMYDRGDSLVRTLIEAH